MMPKEYFKDSEIYLFGKGLERLGEMIQNPRTELEDLIVSARELGLNIRFSVGENNEEISK